MTVPSRVPVSATAAVLAALMTASLGCSSPEADRAQTARRVLVGIPKSTLLDCAGPPQTVRSDGSVEFLTYSSDPRPAGGASSGASGSLRSGDQARPRGLRGTTDVAALDTVRSDYCEARFTVVNGRVSDVTYSSLSGIGDRRYERCYRIISGCLNRVTPTGSDAEPPPVVE